MEDGNARRRIDFESVLLPIFLSIIFLSLLLFIFFSYIFFSLSVLAFKRRHASSRGSCGDGAAVKAGVLDCVRLPRVAGAAQRGELPVRIGGQGAEHGGMAGRDPQPRIEIGKGREHRPANADALIVGQDYQPRDPPHTAAADGVEHRGEGDRNVFITLRVMFCILLEHNTIAWFTSLYITRSVMNT